MVKISMAEEPQSPNFDDVYDPQGPRAFIVQNADSILNQEMDEIQNANVRKRKNVCGHTYFSQFRALKLRPCSIQKRNCSQKKMYVYIHIQRNCQNKIKLSIFDFRNFRKFQFFCDKEK